MRAEFDVETQEVHLMAEEEQKDKLSSRRPFRYGAAAQGKPFSSAG